MWSSEPQASGAVGGEMFQIRSSGVSEPHDQLSLPGLTPRGSVIRARSTGPAVERFGTATAAEGGGMAARTPKGFAEISSDWLLLPFG